MSSRQLLTGRVAIVTGASRGIGRAIATALADEGASVVGTARTPSSLISIADELGSRNRVFLPIAADMAMTGAPARIGDIAKYHFGRIDILVNNAAIVHERVNLADFDHALWREVIEVNLNSVAFLTQTVLHTMIEQRSGKIVNISSIGGRIGGAGQAAYKATKAAMISLTQCVAAEVKQYGIDVNCVCPGGVDTDGFRNAFGPNATDEKPAMKPSAIADIVVFLASDQSSAITGSAIDAFGLSNPIFGR